MAGSKKDAFEIALLNLIFQNANLAAIGDATGLRGSTTAGNFFIALYTAAPSDSAQGTECTYTGYARKDVLRASGAGGWTVSANNAYNTSAITFAQDTVGSNTAVAFTINKAVTAGVDDAIYWGDLSANLAISPGITPEFAAGDLDVYED
jgi:hypothetical protein